MLGALLREGHRFGDRPAIVTADSVTSWSELAAFNVGADLPAESFSGKRVAVQFLADLASLAALAALDEQHCDAFLLDSSLDEDAAMQLSRHLQVAAMLQSTSGDSPRAIDVEWLSEPLAGSGNSTVTILTSGTGGLPKAARHTWQTLARPVRQADHDECQRCLLTYQPHLYAGMQVMLQCLVNYGTLVVPNPEATPNEVLELMQIGSVEYLSATPSYVRRLILFGDRGLLRSLPLKSITLGGEVVDQQILNAIEANFQGARITHLYATTELGRCFSVADKQAGFPTRLLESPSADGIELMIDNGELCVRSANRMTSYDPRSGTEFSGQLHSTAFENDWFRTGDLVQICEDRVHFVGRRSDVINVGGNKVHPIEVERVIRPIAGVADVRVYGQNSSLAGQLVACQIVATDPTDSDSLRQQVAQQCNTKLSSYQRPRVIEIVPTIELTDAGKTSRT